MMVLVANGVWAPTVRRSRVTPSRSIVALELAETDLHGLRSLKVHGHAFTHLLPRWFHLTREDDDSIAIAADAGLTVIPTLDNVDEHGSHPDLVRAILADPEQRADVIKNVVETLDASSLGGIDVHFDGLEEGDQRALATFLAELSAVLRPHGRVTISSVTLHADHPERLRALANLLLHVDYLRVLVSRDAGAHLEPGQDAPAPFFTSMLDALIQVVPPERLIAGISMFGHVWPEGGRARTIDFPQAMALVNLHRGEAAWEPDVGSLRLSYEQAGIRHRAYVDDAPALSNKLAQVKARGLAGVSLARLGAEDPSLWARLAGRGRPEAVEGLGVVPPLPFQFVGSGEIVNLTNDQVRAGRREVMLDSASCRRRTSSLAAACRPTVRRSRSPSTTAPAGSGRHRSSICWPAMGCPRHSSWWGVTRWRTVTSCGGPTAKAMSSGTTPSRTLCSPTCRRPGRASS
jgi:hypothetical protein